MLGLYLFIVLVLVFSHWGYVVPKYEVENPRRSSYDDDIDFVKYLGTFLCLFPPLYILGFSLIYVYKKGVERNEKNNSSIK